MNPEENPNQQSTSAHARTHARTHKEQHLPSPPMIKTAGFSPSAMMNRYKLEHSATGVAVVVRLDASLWSSSHPAIQNAAGKNAGSFRARNSEKITSKKGVGRAIIVIIIVGEREVKGGEQMISVATVEVEQLEKREEEG